MEIGRGLVVRKDGVLCTRCFKTEPVHPGDGTPMGTLIKAYKMLAFRHRNCGGPNEKQGH